MRIGDQIMSIVDAMSVLGALSLLLAIVAYLDGRKAKAYIELMESKYVDLSYRSSTFAADASFNTLFNFFNKGTMPATDVKIRLVYPVGTKILRITPPIKHTESEDGKVKVVEIDVQRMDIDMPLGFLVLSEFEPIAPPTCLYHEQKATQTVIRAKIKN